MAGCKVEYYGDEYGFTVRFYRHCGEGWGKAMSANGGGKSGGNGGKTGADGGKTGGEIIALQDKILDMLSKDNKTSVAEISKSFSIGKRTDDI